MLLSFSPDENPTLYTSALYALVNVKKFGSSCKFTTYIGSGTLILILHALLLDMDAGLIPFFV